MLKGLNDSKQVRPEVRVESWRSKFAHAPPAGQSALRASRRSTHSTSIGRACSRWNARSLQLQLRSTRVSLHRRGAHQVVRRPAGTVDQRRRDLRRRFGGVDLGEGPSRRTAGGAATAKIRATASRLHKGYATPLHIERAEGTRTERPPSRRVCARARSRSSSSCSRRRRRRRRDA